MTISLVRTLAHRRRFRYGTIGLLLAAMFFLEVASMRQESVTADEPQSLTAGYMAWTFGDYRLQTTLGVLPERWFAVPLLFSDVKFPPRHDGAWLHPDYGGLPLTTKFFFGSGNDPNAMVFRGRLMAALLSLLAALAVYGWTARLFGPGAGLVACFSCALCPVMLAQGHVMTADLAVALFFLMSAGCFWSLLRRFTWGRLAASAICFGLLMISKVSGGLMVPMALLMLLARAALGRPWPVRLAGFRAFAVRTWRGRAGLAGAAALAHALAAWAIIWGGYGWQHSPSPDWNADRDSYTESKAAVYGSLSSSARAPLAALDRSRILPEAYTYGLAYTLDIAEHRPAFLDGDYSTTGWWYYFPCCFLFKTPLALIALIGGGAGTLAWRAARRRPGRRALGAWIDRTSPIWSIVVVYGAAAVSSNLNIGQRHLLPVYLPLFMLAGAAGWWLGRGGRWPAVAVAALLALEAVAVVRIHPHYLAYFNALAGGPEKGYLHLTDSNVDWGQDLPSLARWFREHPDIDRSEPVYLRSFSYDTPQRWGIRASPLPDMSNLNPRFSSADPVALRPGTYIISATSLMLPGPPWDEPHERDYRRNLEKFRYLEQSSPPNINDPDNLRMWSKFISDLADSESDRLRGYLMHRPPDAMVGYSILIYRLSDKELHAALLP